MVDVPDWWRVAQPWIAALIFVALAATDAVDGYVARSRNEVTTFGKFIDPLADKLLVTAALVALVDLDRLPSWIALVIISRELVVSGLRMVAVAEGRVIAASQLRQDQDGPADRRDRRASCSRTARSCASSSAPVAWWSSTGSRGSSWPPPWSMTIASMIDYFYHARDILTGPWDRDQSRGA